jgi:flagellar hook-associated protein 3 FlgL
MTTIAPFAAGSYLTNRTASQLVTLKSQLNDLANQVSSGQVAQTYGGLGSGRSTALGAQATLSALTGYAAGITAAQTRTNLAVTSLTQVADLGTSTAQTLNNGLQSTPVGSAAAQSVALGNLQTALDALNQSAAGNYLFGGGNSTTQPVLDMDTILNGTKNSDGTVKQAGLKDLIAQQVKADLGTAGNGRLTQTYPAAPPGGTVPSGTRISLTDDASAHATPSFGYALAGVSTIPASGAVSATYTPGTTGTSASIAVNVAAQPAVGDSLTLALTLPDGTSTTLTLTAAASGTMPASSSTAFAIGSDPTETAKNLNAALQSALTTSAGSTLTANATARAATNFFSASSATVAAGTAPRLVSYDASGEPSYTAGTAANTVIWYRGEDGGGDPSSTQSVQVSATSSVQTGVRANEPAIGNVLAGLATVALGLPSSSNPNATAIYEAVSSQAQSLLSSASTSPSVQDRVTDLSLASARLSSAATTNKATQNAVQNTLDGIEQAPTEEVVAKLLDVQNRLQASYQVTATLSKLSLVNYIS